MKRLILLMCTLLLVSGACLAEEQAQDLLASVDTGKIQSFADQYMPGVDMENVAGDVLNGNINGFGRIYAYIKSAITESLSSTAKTASGIIAPVLLMALLGNAFPDASGGVNGAKFMLMLSLIGTLSGIAAKALSSAQVCMRAAGEFSDIIAPVLTAVTTAAGMNGSAALVSPSAAMAGNIIGRLFSKYGTIACRYALILSVAGNLSAAVDLSPLVSGIRKAVNWCCGLASTLFAALITVQNSVAASLDSTAVKTAKYTVDSFTSIIGSGVSDAWNTYVSGVSIAKNVVGVSGAAAMLAAGIKPIAEVLFSMLLLNMIALFLKLTGETRASKAAEQLSGVCQMALALSCGCAVVAVILVSAAMFAGRGMFF